MLKETEAIRTLAEALAKENISDMTEIMADPYEIPVLYSTFTTTDENGITTDHDLEVVFDLVHDTMTIYADLNRVSMLPITVEDLTCYAWEDLYDKVLPIVKTPLSLEF